MADRFFNASFSLDPGDDVDFVILLSPGYEAEEAIFRFDERYGNNSRLTLMRLSPIEHFLQGNDPYYNDCFHKLRVFELYKLYSRIIYVDADAVMLRNFRPLFDIDLKGFIDRRSDGRKTALKTQETRWCSVCDGPERSRRAPRTLAYLNDFRCRPRAFALARNTANHDKRGEIRGSSPLVERAACL